VSAVGHETDVTIADLVADLRAPTPSAAAELVVPDKQELGRRLTQLQARMAKGVGGKMSSLRQYLDYLAMKFKAASPAGTITARQQAAQGLRLRMDSAVRRVLERSRAEVSQQSMRLEAMSPLKVLARGYSLTRLGALILKSEQDVMIGDTLTTTLATGTIRSVVTGKEESHEF